MSVDRAAWGTVEGRPVDLFTLDNGRGVTAKLSTYGGIVTSLCVPDRQGDALDVVLGFDSLEEYVNAKPYFGAIVGRVANRIGGGSFSLGGVTYQLTTNDGAHHLHGGQRGWDKVVWSATELAADEDAALRLAYRSPDGEEGYPGNVEATVEYRLTAANELCVEMKATTDAPTPLSIVHHAYWNLAGHGSGSALDHTLQLHASRYTPADPGLIPTGEIVPVRGTPYDFTAPKTLRTGIDALQGYEDPASSFDTNYVLDGFPARAGALLPAARASCARSGVKMELATTMPGVQLYAGHFIDEIPGKNGAVYEPHGGFCLETQYFPDAINKRELAGWPDPVLRPGETYRHTMVHRFGLL